MPAAMERLAGGARPARALLPKRAGAGPGRLTAMITLGPALGVLALTAWSSPASAQALRIDLTDPDPALLGELPGISAEEVDRLAALGGLGAQDLEARLAASEIAPERLRAWIPYLEFPAPSGRIALTLRARAERGPAEGARALLELGARGAGWEGRLRRSEAIGLNPSGAGPRLEGRISFSPHEAIVATAGTVRPGTTGPDPWEDPLKNGSAVQIATPEPILATAATTVGLSVRAGGLVAAASRDRRGGGRVLAAWDRRDHGLFWGRAEGEGSGIGARGRLGKALLSLVLHDPRGRGPLLRGLARSEGMALSAAWALARAHTQSAGRLDASVQGVRGWAWIRAGGSLRLSRSGAPRGFLRASLTPRLGPSSTSSLEVVAQDGRSRLDLDAGKRFGGGSLRLVIRLERRDRWHGAGLCLEGGRSGPVGAISGSILARTDARSSLAKAGVSGLRGRWGALLGGARTLPHGAVSLRALLPLDAASTRRVLREVSLRFEIERHADQ